MKKSNKENSTIAGKLLSSMIKEISGAINLAPDRLVHLLAKQLEQSEKERGVKKVDTTKIRSRVSSKLDSFQNETTTFKSFLDYLRAIRIPVVVITIELRPNMPNIPIVIKRTLRFSGTPDLRELDKKQDDKPEGGGDELIDKDKQK